MDGMWWLDVWRIPTAAGGHHHLFKWLLKMKCVDTGSVLGFEQQGASPQGTETRLYWIVSFHFLLVCCCCCWVFFCSRLFNWPLWELLTFSHWVDTLLLYFVSSAWYERTETPTSSLRISTLLLSFSAAVWLKVGHSATLNYSSYHAWLTHTHTHTYRMASTIWSHTRCPLHSSFLHVTFSLEELCVESCRCILYVPRFLFCESSCILFNKGSYCTLKYCGWPTKFHWSLYGTEIMKFQGFTSSKMFE